MTQPANPLLADLKDIHYPEAISAWPPAIGWWILLLIFIVFCIMASLSIRAYIKRNRYRWEASKALQALQADEAPTTEYCSKLALLIKQTLQNAPKDTSALVSGSTNDFYTFLAKSLSEDHAKLLSMGRYQASTDVDVDPKQLTQSVQQWIKKHTI